MSTTPEGTSGWHPDPTGEPQERYWDGEEWTSQTRPYPAPGASRPTTQPGATVPEPQSPSPSGRGKTIALVGLVVAVIAAGVGGLVVWRQGVDQAARDAAAQGAQIGGPPMSEVEDLFCPDGPDTDTTGTGIDCSGTERVPSAMSTSLAASAVPNEELAEICSRLKGDMARKAEAWYEQYPRKSHPETAVIEAASQADPAVLPLLGVSQDMHSLGSWIQTTADAYYVFLVDLNQRPLPTLSMTPAEAKAEAQTSKDFALSMSTKEYIEFIRMATSSFEGAEAGVPPVSWDSIWSALERNCP